MARRNDHTRDELRERALAVAEQIVQADGLPALSARRVAAGIGYSVGSLYTVFTNLDDLCWQLNARTLAELLHTLEQVREPPPAARLHAYAEAYLQFARQQPERWRLLFEHRAPEGAQMPDELAQRIERLFALINACLRPLFPHADEAQLALRARTLWSGVHGIVQLSAGDKLFLPQARAERAMLGTLIDGLLAGWEQEAGHA